MDNRRGPVLGAHLSIAGGLERALADAAALGCECLQIFVKNQRQWRAPPLRKEQIATFRDMRNATRVSPVVAHASYLLNLASPHDRVRQQSIDAIIDELQRCEALGVDYLVFHPGAHMTPVATKPRSDEATKGNAETQKHRNAEMGFMEAATLAGIERISSALDDVHRRCAGFGTMILLETTAGQGTAIGWRFEHLRGILDRVAEADRLGVCLDTCHLFAAGYDFRTAEGYGAMVQELDRVIGVARVRCIHMNDSKRELGSRVDRHEHIGKGKIGKAGFSHFLNDVRFAGVPMILETPKGVDGRGTNFDRVNLRRLRVLIA